MDQILCFFKNFIFQLLLDLTLLSFGGTYPDGSERKGYSKDYIRSFSAVLQQSFRFAVSPKQYITFNPMQYIKLKYQTDEVDLFSDDDMDGDIQPIPREDYERLIEFLQNYNPPAILPIQIAYYAGLRIGEACGLAWQDVNLEEQCLTIRRSIRYDGSRHKNIIGPTKRKKVRIVDFGDTLAEILRNARKEQLKNRMQYGELYHKNYYREVKDKNRVYYEFYHLDGTENVPEDYKEISFVCLRPDGSLELPSTLGIVCRKIAQKLDGFEGFHFHQLRHTYTSNLLANGAAPKDVQELLGHSDVSTTMNVYAHSTRKASGELYFDVQADAEHPFVVEAGDSRVTVLGTAFNLNTYPEEQQVLTTLVRGAVEFQHGNASVRLKPGQQAVLDVRTQQLDTRQVDVSLYTSWVNGIFEYERMPLADIMRQLARWYDIGFIFEAAEFHDHPFTGIARRDQTLDEILGMIAKTTGVAFEISGKTVLIKKQ